MNSQYAAALSRKTNQANMTDYDIRANSLVLVGCLAKRKRPINRRVQKRLDVERFHHFGTVFVKADRETEKWCRSRVCLCDKVAAACNSTVAASATLSRDKDAHSCDKIAQ